MYEIEKFEHVLDNEILPNDLLEIHFGLYEGYVKNTNNILELVKKEEGSYQSGEIIRRFGWEWNGMRLHELYFGNLMKNSGELKKGGALFKKIENDFGSYENWETDFKAKALMRGIGWVILCLDRKNEKLFNVWINEHDSGHLTGSEPILVLDVFEHAFMPAKLKKIEYVEAFFNLISWNTAEARYEK